MRHLLSILAAGCLALGAQEFPRFVMLGSTIGPIDSGIVDALETAFEAETGIRVRHAGAGTGAALDMARRSGIDLVMVHARRLEEAFVKEGFGLERIPLMYNDFVIVGPSADPAGIRGTRTAAEALKTLAAKQAPFLTRGDQSGTHVAELDLWTAAAVKPAGPWYQVFAKGTEGNAPTLRHADQNGLYTVIDRATWLALKPELKGQILVEGDEALLNHISLIPVNPAKVSKVNTTDAAVFVAWLTHPHKGQKLIAEFGKVQYVAPMFFPEARKQ